MKADVYRVGILCVMVLAMSSVVVMSYQEDSAPSDAEFVDALWVAKDRGLYKIDVSDASTLLELPDIEDVRALDIDDRRGLVWAFSKGRLRGISFGGEVRFSVPEHHRDRKDRGRDNDDDDDDDDRDDFQLPGDKPFGLRVNANTGTVWLGLERVLYQFDSNANLVQILRLPDKGEALALDELGSYLWVATRRALLCYDATGTLVYFIDLGRKARVRDIEVDPDSGDIWVVERDSLSYLETTGRQLFKTKIKKLTQIVTDYQGGAWLARDKTLLHIDPFGEPFFELRPFGRKGEKLLALAADPLRGSVWVADKKRLAEVSADGEVLRTLEPIGFGKKKGNLRAVALYVDVIAPEIAFMAPQEGALMKESAPALMVSFADLGGGVDPATLRFKVNGAEWPVSCPFADQAAATCFPDVPLPEGLIELSARVGDFNGNPSDPAQVQFVVDTIPPEITFASPLEGEVLKTMSPSIRLEYSDIGSGVDSATLVIQGNGSRLNVTCATEQASATCDPVTPLPVGPNNLTATIQDPAGNFSAPAELSFTIHLGEAGLPVLDPIGNQVVPLGSTLTLKLTSSDPDGDPLAFSASPVPLPANSSLNASSGVFTFTPSPGQVGIITLTFIVSEGARTDSETINITVQGAPIGGLTSFKGRLLDANDFELGRETPVVGATISFLGTGQSALSNTEGNFTVTHLPAGSQVLDIDTSTADPGPDAALYGGFREELELIASVNNIVSRPFFLPRIAVSSLTPVNPSSFTIVINPDLEVSLIVPPNTAKNPDGTNFTGELSISLVPRDLAPAALPDFLDPGLLITIQPVGITFATPVPITFPNIDSLPAGSQVDIWSLDADLGVFSIVGTGLVSADGTQIETISGGIRATDWHSAVSPPGEPDVDVPDAPGPSQDDPKAAECDCTSVVQLQNGSIEVDIFLPSYRSLGVSRSLRVVYNTSWANPRPVIPFNSTIPVRNAVPPALSYQLSVAGIAQGSETFVNTSGLNENIDETIRNAVSFDGTTFDTGLYPFTLRLTSNYPSSRISADIEGSVQLRNESQSPVGAGWAVDGMERIFTNFDGSLSVVSSQGALILFIPKEISPPFVNFSSPAGDFSTLVKNGNGTFIRTLKDGTQINFDSQGFQILLVDRNGNTTSYSYDANGRLTSINDPADLTTTLTYSGDLLSSVTDPVGRTTSFSHNAQGDLTQMTFPDTTTWTFGYDDRHLMISETNQRGFTVQREYDSLGRFVTGTRADGMPVSATNVQSVGFVDPVSGTGTEANPAPVVRPDQALNTLTDGKGNTTSFETDQFGAITRQVDSLGQTTLIDRNDDGNSTQIKRPNGAEVTMTYDSVGNLLTSTDPIGATTSFTYDSNFNQVTSITDPRNSTTTIHYDLKGNPIEIIDALNNRTEMTYDSRGLLTSVAAAVDEPQENLTTFTYDANGNLLTTTDPLFNVTALEYDSAGNVIRSTDGENRVTQFIYDSMNRLISVVDANLKVTQYSYDARGNLTQVIDAKNQTTSFTYDEMDRLISASNPLSLTETFAYDANSNLLSTTNRNSQTLTFDYDALNRLIQKTLPPSASQIGDQITTFDFDLVGNLTAVTNPAITVSNHYDLASRLISSFSSDEETLAGATVLITQDTTIGAGNQDFEGKTIQVNASTLTVDGSHTFANLLLLNGTILTHSPTTGFQVGNMDLTVTGTLQIDATSRIDVSGRGFLGGNKPGNPFGPAGMTVGFQQGSTGKAAGSYGGLGGGSGGPSNPVYGDFRDPYDPGSGGSRSGLLGGAGNGGGLIRIVAQGLTLDGVIQADGELPSGCCGGAGGGSGGGIRIDAGTLSGTGSVTASGGNGLGSIDGGGGGGRVAIYYQNPTTFDFTQVTAFAGAGNVAPNGGAGTVYLRGPGRETGELVLDNNTLVAPDDTTPIFTIPVDVLDFTRVKISRGARAKVEEQLRTFADLDIWTNARLAASDRVIASAIRVDDASEFDSAVDVSALSLDVTNGSVLGQLPTTGMLLRKLELAVQTLTVDLTSRIDVSGRGFLGRNKPGNPLAAGMTVGFQQGSTGKAAGSYGGLGGASDGTPNPVNGDATDPSDPGSGGSRSGLLGGAGNGGGLIRIVAQGLTLDGVIQAEGEFPSGCCGGAGGGSGGGIRIDAGTLSGTGSITASGGNGLASFGAGGGGGRVAIYFETLLTFNLAQVTALGGLGAGAADGQDGSVFVQQQPLVASFEKLRAQLHEIRKSGIQVGERHRDEAPREPAIRYLAMLAEKADRQVDFDPVYTYDLNG
ncbi:MAG: hypothetical protein O7G29_04760, partial [Acidobacteria bacterium]|nr:hypothetical protein [Acidobacteriota bacterium]